MDNNKIDFVVTWVDGNDPEWLKEKNYYKNGGKYESTSTSDNRFKDWGLFKYWFRGVEKFAPWVNKIYLITWGHLPEWLNIDNPKLVIINHKDYIPEKYLPTFNSNVIEMNIHRIKGLSENFVLFNDDFYLISKTKQTDFFKNNIPCDTVGLNVHCPSRSLVIQSICNNDVAIINEHFNFKSTMKKNLIKFLNPKNGISNIFKTLVLIKCPRYPGFWQPHGPLSYNKHYFKDMWKLEENEMDNTSKNRFRKNNEINHWLVREWQIVTGNFEVRSHKFCKVYHLNEIGIDKKCKSIISDIKNQKEKCIVINDSSKTDQKYNDYLPEIIETFESILPEKSSFEK